MTDLEKLIKQNALNLFKLEEDNNYVLVVCSSTTNYVIPYIKEGMDCMAFISPKYSISDYNRLSKIVNMISDNCVYKDMFAFTPIRSEAPEHSHIITSFIKAPLSEGKASSANAVLEAAGYDISRLDSSISKVDHLDYSKLLEEDEFARDIYEDDLAAVDTIGAKFESLDSEIQLAALAIASGRTRGMILTGPTGTGKSFACRVIATKLLVTGIINIQIYDGTTVEDLVGMYVPNDDPSSDSKFKFVPGPLLTAYVKGYAIVIEEANFGQPGIIAILNQFTDFTSRFTYYGVTYKKHKNFVCFMTMNPGYEGTEVLNIALKNRFAIVNVPALTRVEFAKRAMSYSKMLGHELAFEFFGRIYDFAALIEKQSKGSKWHENIKYSIRNAQRVAACVLLKKCSLQDFEDIMAIQYLNALSCDNDNSAKLEDFKKSEEIKAKIADIYSMYDFQEIKEIDVSVSFDDFFKEEEEGKDKSKEKDARKKAIKDLFGESSD